jgi:hypothetical protein
MPTADASTLSNSAAQILAAFGFAAILAAACALIAGGLMRRLLDSIEGPASLSTRI